MNIANYRPFSLYVAHHGSRIIGECGEHWRQVADIQFAHPEENNTGNLYSSDGGLNIVAVGRPGTVLDQPAVNKKRCVGEAAHLDMRRG